MFCTKIYYFLVAALQLSKGINLLIYTGNGHKDGAQIACVIFHSLFAIAAAVFLVLIAFKNKKVLVFIAAGLQVLMIVMACITPYVLWSGKSSLASAWLCDGIVGPFLIMGIMFQAWRDNNEATAPVTVNGGDD